MPGYAADEQVKEKFTWPADTWLKLHAGRTVLLQIHTNFMPENTRGLWRHDVMLPKHDRPTPVPCPGNGCPLCAYNREKGKDATGKYPFPSRRVGFAIGSIHAEIQAGKWVWLDPLEQGLIEKGPEFWATLTAAETNANQPDELEPDKPLLDRDWTQWLIRLECTNNGVKAKAVAPKPQHPLWDMPADRVTYYLGLYELRCKPWNDLDGLLQRVLTRQGKAQGTVQVQAVAVDAAGNGEVDDIDFDEEKPAAPAPAKPALPAAAAPPAPGGFDGLTRGQMMTRFDQACRRVAGDANWRGFRLGHLKKHYQVTSPVDLSDDQLKQEITSMEARAVEQQA